MQLLVKRIKFLLYALSVTFYLAVADNTYSAEMIMLEQQGCSWCERWHIEIGQVYPKTEEAKIAPLRTVDIDQPWPADLENIKPDRFTPTFVLVDNGIEIGRMRGYAGDTFFWFLLDEMLEKLPNS